MLELATLVGELRGEMSELWELVCSSYEEREQGSGGKGNDCRR